jgi:hypothetical protein
VVYIAQCSTFASSVSVDHCQNCYAAGWKRNRTQIVVRDMSLRMLPAFRKHPRFLAALVRRNVQLPIKSVFCSNVTAAGNAISSDVIADTSSHSIVARPTISNEISTSVGSYQNLAKSNLQLTGEIDYIFKAQHMSKTMLSNFVINNLVNLEPPNLAHLMRITGKLTKSRRDMLLRFYMPAISARLRMLSTKSWNFKNISCIIFGLQRMNESDDGILDILETMTRISDELAMGTQVPLPLHVSMMMLGLEKNHCTEKETRNFLKLIVKMIKSCQSDFEAHHISSCLFGLQSTTSEGLDVREVLSILIERINESTDDFQPQNVSSALYGLQGMSGKEPVVLALLVALEAKIRTCKGDFKPKDVAHSLHGLQGMNSDHAEVRNILRALEPRIKSCTEPLDAMLVSDAMIGLQGMSSDCPEVLAILKAITSSLRKYEPRKLKEGHKSKDGKENKEIKVSKDVIGRKDSKVINLSKESTEIKVIAKQTDDLYDDEEEDEVEYVRPLDAQGVRNVLRGLRRMSSDSEEVRSLLKAVGPRLLGSTQTMNAYQLRAAFSGIKGLESKHSEVRPVVITLIQKVRQCKQVFSPQCVGTSLACLSGMSSEKYEVRDLAAALAPCVDLCVRPLSAQLVGDVMFGLQGMNSDHAEVGCLIKSVTGIVRQCKGDFDAESASRALCGLREMTSRCEEVPPLLAALSSKTSHFNQFKSAKELSDTLYALQGMTTDCPEFSALLVRLTPKIVRFKEPFSSDEIVRALYGLQGVRSGGESTELMSWLYSKVEELKESTDCFEDLPSGSLLQLCQMITIMIPTLKAPKLEGLKWIEINDIVTQEVEMRRKRSDAFFSEEKFLSVAAKRVFSLIEQLFSNSEVEIVKGHVLFGLFETEILLRLPSKEGEKEGMREGVRVGEQDVVEEGVKECEDSSSAVKSDILLNIEINWAMDRLDKQKKYCALRDSYLCSRGVAVERLNLSSIKRVKDGYLGEMVTGFVQDARLRSRTTESTDTA